MKRSKHNLSNYKLATMDMGQLVPVNCMEVLPGDTFDGSTSALVRVSPLQAPVMHPVTVRIHHWFVPNRIIWDGFEDFITGGPDGLGSAEEYPVKTIAGGGGAGFLSDYLGVPPSVDDQTVSALPLRAYNLIFNEFYRDEDLTSEVDQDSNLIRSIAWEKDYFTTCRPWTQKGPEVTLPVGSAAPVRVNGAVNDTVAVEDASGTQHDLAAHATGNNVYLTSNAAGELMYADLSTASAININDFRLAFALQRYQEARARFGSRFTEYLRYLGIRPSDARLNRPEYLGGGKTTLSFSEVLQTGTDPATPVGDLKGHGIAAVRSNRYRKFFEEHGIVMSLMSVRPKAIYVNSRHRMWDRRTKEEYWQKELETIGQQEVFNQEVHQDHADPNGVFGYQDRYREYREHPSTVCDEFRTLLDYWHLGRDFATDPALNNDFVKCVPTKRVFSEQTQKSLWVMAQNRVRARRLVSKSARSKIL